VAICYIEPPIDFEALDGKPVHTLFTVVSSSTRTHLHFLALIAHALQDARVIERLSARAGADELLPEVERVERDIAARRGGTGAP
jgi:PTS system nitrogen regulatory IIA component